MSLLKFIKAQLGMSPASSNNFTLDASAQDGTMKLSRGNAGATTQDVLVVGANGKLTAPQGIESVGGLPAFQCRAWVNFDGTRDSTGAASSANTARYIRASGNVSSVVRTDAGSYIVTVTGQMPDANYVVLATSHQAARLDLAFPQTQSQFKIISAPYYGAGHQDVGVISVGVFR